MCSATPAALTLGGCPPAFRDKRSFPGGAGGPSVQRRSRKRPAGRVAMASSLRPVWSSRRYCLQPRATAQLADRWPLPACMAMASLRASACRLAPPPPASSPWAAPACPLATSHPSFSPPRGILPRTLSLARTSPFQKTHPVRFKLCLIFC